MKTIKENSVGYIISFDDGNDVYYVGDCTMDGVIFKDEQAFKNKTGICYIPEYGFYTEDDMNTKVSDDMLYFMYKHGWNHVSDGSGGFTYDDLYECVAEYLRSIDLLDKVNDINHCVEFLFQELTWQFPSTLVQEIDWEEQLKIFLN